MIVVEMVHNCPPDDWLHFAQTSKYSNWLVKRAHPKKILDDLCITFTGQRFNVACNRRIGEISESEVLNEGFCSSSVGKNKALKNMLDDQNSNISRANFQRAKEFFENLSTAGSKTLNTNLSARKVGKKYFDLFCLPLELQNMIVVEMVHNCPPDDWLHFAQTSKYSNWLVKRAHPKKILDDLCITFTGQRFSAAPNRRIGEISESEVLKLLQTCQIKCWYSQDYFFNVENNYWTPEFEKACFDSTRFLNELAISFTTKSEVRCLKFYQNLQCLKTLYVTDYVSNVLTLPKLPRSLYIARLRPGFARDDSPDILINLAQKTKDFPLSFFKSKIKFDPNDVQQFLQNGIFHDHCSFSKIKFDPNDVQQFLQNGIFHDLCPFVFHVDFKKLSNFEKMFMSLGGKKLSVSEFQIPALHSDQNVGEFSILLTFQSFLINSNIS
uniref:F-box domain-containing protein n=1 Tax=Panagrolaimus sp. JU765 TaxID=591449 RepID=A0AC34PYJ9_9BILA